MSEGQDRQLSTLLEKMRAARLTAGLNPDKRPATTAEIMRARAAKEDSTPFTDEHAMREERLAEIEDRRPVHRVRI